MQKRILVISDISCVGKCSLTAALPILSACGHECVILPTAVLSTHTAADFGAYTCRDLTDELSPIIQHWLRLGLHFDAIFIGYLTSAAQAQLVAAQVAPLRSADTLWIVDPILGDNGQLYRGLSTENIDAIKALCAEADVITPNLTEGALLAGLDPKTVEPETLLCALASLGAARCVLTGAPFPPAHIGIHCRDYTDGSDSSHRDPRIQEMLHGTGDVFASAFVGLYLRGIPFHDAAARAATFTAACIRQTVEAPDRRWYGIRFEPELKTLAESVE